MGQASKVDLLPEETRQALEQRLIAGAFGGYDNLVDWLEQQGFQISRSSLHRWGSKFEDRVRAIKVATDQARAIVEASPDSEAAVNDALIRLVQERLFFVLTTLEGEPNPITMGKVARAIADLGRATISQKRLAAEARKAAREELLAEQADRLDALASEQGLGEDQVRMWKERFLGLKAS